MLALRSGFRRPHSLPSFPHTFTSRHGRTLPFQRRFLIQNLCDGFLDLAIALPLPPSLPPYSTAIILVTVVTRLALLPISIWGKNRSWRIEEIVLPEIEKLKPVVSKRVFEEMQKAGIRGDKKYLQEFHAKRSIEILTARRKELFKEHKCRPLPSVIVPPLSQLPIFIISTIALGRMSLDPTPFDSESFLTLTTLAHPDPTMTLPIILGIITMANVESSNWVMNATERERAREIEEQNEKRSAKIYAESGKRSIQPKKYIKSGMRILSVGRIIVAAMTPGSIALYWLTSATFGLIQTWVMDWMDVRRRRLIPIPNHPPPHSPITTPPASASVPTPSRRAKARR